MWNDPDRPAPEPRVRPRDPNARAMGTSGNAPGNLSGNPGGNPGEWRAPSGFDDPTRAVSGGYNGGAPADDPRYAPTQRAGRYDPTGPYDSPPPYTPVGPQYPGGRPPQWPGPAREPEAPAQPPTRPSSPPPSARPRGYDDYAGSRASAGEYAEAPAYPSRARGARDYDAGAYAPPARQYDRRYDERSARRRPARGVSLPHLPVAHLFLIIGVALMAFALTLPWGMDANGSNIFIHNFTSARAQSQANVDTGQLAQQVATDLVLVIAVLSGALILFNTVITILNKLLGVVGLSGCASLLFFPVLWGGAALLCFALLAAGGFAGIGALSNLPFVRDHAFSDVAVTQNALGFYLWLGGVGATFLGMLGQLALRRR